MARKINRETIYKLVDAERERQDKMWGRQDHNPAIWLAILVEEVGEVAAAIIGMTWEAEKQRPANIEKELIQVVAVVVATIESGLRNKWLELPPPEQP